MVINQPHGLQCINGGRANKLPTHFFKSFDNAMDSRDVEAL